MRTSDKNYPETIEELIAECHALSDRYDLYSLKQTEPDEFTERLGFTPNRPPSGEYEYGCAMVPVQWVTNVLNNIEDEVSSLHAIAHGLRHIGRNGFNGYDINDEDKRLLAGYADGILRAIGEEE